MHETTAQGLSELNLQHRPQAEARPSGPEKKQFVEPEVSSPVDVLESTTFFQFTDSGVVPGGV